MVTKCKECGNMVDTTKKHDCKKTDKFGKSMSEEMDLKKHITNFDLKK